MSRPKTVFRDLPASRETLVRPPFRTVELRAGATVVAEGDTRKAVFLLEEGTVDVQVDGRQVATLGPGAVFGEIGLFTDTVRTASVRATSDVVVRMLDEAGYATLRAADDPVAGWIERRAASQLLTRFRALVADVKLDATPAALLDDPISPRAADGVQVPVPRAVLGAALMVAFPDAPRSGLRRLAHGARMTVYQDGQTLLPFGMRDSAYGVLLEGEVRAAVPTDEGAVSVVTLQGGEAIGFMPVVDGKPRPVHLVATMATSVLWLDPRIVADHVKNNDLGPLLRGPLIRTLASAVMRANVTVSMNEVPPVRVQGAAPVPAGSLPPLQQQVFEPLPLDSPIGFGEPEGDWDTWFDMGGSGPREPEEPPDLVGFE